MIARQLGAHGPPVGAIGIGCMGMSEFYDPVGDDEAIATIRRAIELGVTLIDTSDMYGRGENERLVGRALRGRRERATLATKGGLLRRDDDPGYRAIDGTPAHLRAACDASLQRLGVDHIDLYYLHRADPQVAIEESVGALAELMSAGKIRCIGLSEVDAGTLRRAAAVAPIAALQSEYSLFTRDVETSGVLAAARELDVALVAYAPLGRGMLTGAVRTAAHLHEHDLRRRVPRFEPANLERNLVLVDGASAIAREIGCTPGQLALAWLLAQGDNVIPLPGTEHVAHLEQNAAAAGVALDPAQLARLDALFRPGAAAGARFEPQHFGDR